MTKALVTLVSVCFPATGLSSSQAPAECVHALNLMLCCSTSCPQALSFCIPLLPFHLNIFIPNPSHPGLGLLSQKVSITSPQHSNGRCICIQDLSVYSMYIRYTSSDQASESRPIIYFWFILVTTLCLLLYIMACSQTFSLRGELCQRVIRIKAAQYKK